MQDLIYDIRPLQSKVNFTIRVHSLNQKSILRYELSYTINKDVHFTRAVQFCDSKCLFYDIGPIS